MREMRGGVGKSEGNAREEGDKVIGRETWTEGGLSEGRGRSDLGGGREAGIRRQGAKGGSGGNEGA